MRNNNFFPAAACSILIAFSSISCRENSENAALQLSLAAGLGDVEQARAALNAGAPVDGSDADGYTALGYASARGDALLGQLLLSRGADPLLPDTTGYTPFDYAIERFQPGILDLLLETMATRSGSPDLMLELFDMIVAGDDAGARRAAEFLRDNSGDPSLLSLAMVFAAAHSEADVLNQLLIVRQDPDGANASGYTPLAMAARFGCLECVTMLLDEGADPNWQTTSRYQTTALMEASRDGRVEIGRLLLARGADVNKRDVFGDHALNWAVYFGETEFVRMLLDAGANTAIRGQTDEFALQIAEREGHDDIVELLQDRR